MEIGLLGDSLKFDDKVIDYCLRHLSVGCISQILTLQTWANYVIRCSVKQLFKIQACLHVMTVCYNILNAATTKITFGNRI